MYYRVIPRDFFNEAKLLKCMGLLSLKILDNMTPATIKIEENGEPFDIVLNSDAALEIINYEVCIEERQLTFASKYNSKDNYPLFCEWNYEEIRVFTEQGEFSKEFIDLCAEIKSRPL